MKTKVYFEGIDQWHRPVFRSVLSRERFCCTDKLFRHGATESEVLDLVDENDLTYKGRSFEAEPEGTMADVQIVPEKEYT